MTHKFEVGDKAIIIENYDIQPRNFIGEIVTIVEPLQLLTNTASRKKALVYLVDLPSNGHGGLAGFEPHMLKPYYDGNEKTEWDESIFKPKELVRCLNDSATVEEEHKRALVRPE